MMLHPILLLTIFWGLPSCMPPGDKEVLPFRLGKTVLNVERTRFTGKSDVFIVHIHDNEVTAAAAAETVLDSTGGTLLSLDNDESRLIRFKLKGDSVTADPNRIFTPAGRKTTLEKLSRYSDRAEEELSDFASFFLDKLPDSGVLIAMHNNTPDAYSISSYTAGGDTEGEASDLHINPLLDPDDFYITTSAEIFSSLRERDMNVVLQHESVTDDGSLSVYFGRRNRGYVNIEAEHGHLEVQMEMLRVLLQILPESTFQNGFK